jgi:hypothetical protein
VNRHQYLAEAIRLYLQAPDTPVKATRRDWAIAAHFYSRKIPLENIAHAIRIASLRRHMRDANLDKLEPIHSLAYYRTVLEGLQPDALDPGYVQYVSFRYQHYFGQQNRG